MFACILLQGSIMYNKAPRRYQIKAENAKIGIADVPIERNPVMEVPALVFAARRGIDVLDWCVRLRPHLSSSQAAAALHPCAASHMPWSECCFDAGI
jgi:hypothetical protein